ncbi:MAG: TetR/AcrR family transcriptional regulator [Micromonosporaceae bacterium]
MTSGVRPFRGVSAKDRRAQRCARLLEAGLDVIGADGVAGLTMTAVCGRAGLTERYFYESFRNRDELLVAVFDEVSGQLYDEVNAALTPPYGDLVERGRAALGVLIDGLTDDPRKARLFTEAIGHDALRQRRTVRIGEFADLLAAQARDLYGLHHTRDLERLKLATLVIVGGMADAAASWLAGEIALSREEFIDESALLAVAASETIRATSKS